MARVKRDPETKALKAAYKGTLLEKLMPHIPEDVRVVEPGELTPLPKKPIPLLRRLTASWQHPMPLQEETLGPAYHEQKIGLFMPEEEETKKMGIVLHKLFYLMSLESIDLWHPEKMPLKQPLITHLLRQQWILPQKIAEATDKVMATLAKTLLDPRGRWILKHNHLDAKSEYAVTTHGENGIKHFVVDRTFVDEGCRWIIDYKFALHGDCPLNVFLKQQKEKYQEQLENYKLALGKIDERPIKLGLYFPFLGEWVEV